jgi:hypothetical protein
MLPRGIVVAVLSVCLLAIAPVGPSYAAVTKPPTGTHFDYQLGGNRSVPGHVGIVVRDRKAAPKGGRYNICYVNGFQTQAEERPFWKRKHWNLVLKKRGRPVVDENWGEWLLDIRTGEKRRKLTKIVGRWIDGCADDGYAGVEFDNLDSFLRSKGLIDKADTKAFARKLVRRAHRADLAAAQKNRAQWNGRKVGFDFAIAESCARWRECGSYVDHYGRRVLAVEYRNKDFRRACRSWGDRVSVVRRDLALSKDGTRRWC